MVFDQVSRVIVFRSEGKQRKYVGNLTKGQPDFDKLHNLVKQGKALKGGSLTRVDFELALVGSSFHRVVRCDADKGTMAVYSGRKPQVVIQLPQSPKAYLARAKPRGRLTQKLEHTDRVQVQLRGAPRLEEVVKNSSLIFVGIPVDIVRNEYTLPRDATAQYTVFVVGVVRYLKDATGLDDPVALLNHHGGYLGGGFEYRHDPLPMMGEEYLFFLGPPRSQSVMHEGKLFRKYYGSEYDHYPEALLKNNTAQCFYPRLTWLNGSEKEVIARVEAEIKRQQGQ